MGYMRKSDLKSELIEQPAVLKRVSDGVEGSPAAMGGLVTTVFSASHCSQAGSAWDQPFPWRSAGPPVALYFGAFVWYIPYITKQLQNL